MNQKCVFSIMVGSLTIIAAPCNAKCDAPTVYKTCHYYTVFLTRPDKSPENFYVVLTKDKHARYGGQCHQRLHCEPIIRFEQFDKSSSSKNQGLAFVHYNDFMDAINSDQPAHNVRVRSKDTYITLSKVFAREFRNGLAGSVLNKIVHAGRA